MDRRRAKRVLAAGYRQGHEIASSARAASMAGRCFGDGDPVYEQYHDREWGFPVLDEHGLFERMALEAFQSGLSARRTVLLKRPAFREGVRGL